MSASLESSPEPRWYKCGGEFLLCLHLRLAIFYSSYCSIETVRWRGLFFCGKYQLQQGLSKPELCEHTTLRLVHKVTQKQTGIRGKKSKDSSAWVSTSGQWVYLQFRPTRCSFPDAAKLAFKRLFSTTRKPLSDKKSNFWGVDKTFWTNTKSRASVSMYVTWFLLERCLLSVAQLCEKYQRQRLLRQRKHLILNKQLSKPMSNS